MAYHYELESELAESLELEIEHELARGRNSLPMKRTNMLVFANLGRAQTLLRTISGFSRYRREVRSLPPAEQARIDQVARLVLASHAKGRRPIATIRLVGHADFDTPRRPSFERRISGDRARSVQRALNRAGDPPALPGRQQ